MVSTRARSLTLVIAAGALVLGGCRDNRNSDRPVVTTTEQGATVAPSKNAAENRDVSLVRVIDAIPSGGFDLWADDQKAFGNTQYKQVTDYKEFKENQVNFRLRKAGADTTGDPLATNREMMTDGTYHTVVIIPGEKGKAPEMRVLGDEVSTPQAGKARLRVVHAAPNVGEIDVFAATNPDPVFSGINFMTEAGYKDVDPISGSLQVRPQHEKMVLATIPNASIEAGKTYTIVVTGPSKGKSKLDAVVVEDKMGPATAGDTTRQTGK